jgi:hypothetical protein
LRWMDNKRLRTFLPPHWGSPTGSGFSLRITWTTGDTLPELPPHGTLVYSFVLILVWFSVSAYHTLCTLPAVPARKCCSALLHYGVAFIAVVYSDVERLLNIFSLIITPTVRPSVYSALNMTAVFVYVSGGVFGSSVSPAGNCPCSWARSSFLATAGRRTKDFSFL